MSQALIRQLTDQSFIEKSWTRVTRRLSQKALFSKNNCVYDEKSVHILLNLDL